MRKAVASVRRVGGVTLGVVELEDGPQRGQRRLIVSRTKDPASGVMLTPIELRGIVANGTELLNALKSHSKATRA